MRSVKFRSPVLFGFALLCAGTLASAKPSVECGATLTRSTTLDADLVCGASALTIATPGVVLNCSGHAIRGTVLGGIGIQVTATNVSVIDCAIKGFTSGLQARDASGLKVARNHFSNLNSAVRVNTSHQALLADNLFESSLGNISIRDCPQAVVERNEFHPLERHAASINLERSPGARIVGNRSTQGLSIATWRSSDDSVVANNALGRIGRVSVGFSSRVDVRHNSAGGFGSAYNGSLFGVELTGAKDCEVAHNEFAGVGVFLYPFFESGPHGSTIIAGADGNRIRDNTIEEAV